MYKNIKVVILPTNKKASIQKFGNQSRLNQFKADNLAYWMNLYFLSDEETGFNISKGSWFYDTRDKIISNNSLTISNFSKKIIATTDESLTPLFCKTSTKSLPKPSQEFIQHFVGEYNKGNIITEVEVEYEEYAVGNYGMSDGEPTIDERLKVNPKDNCITIKPTKNSWSREEVVNLIMKYALDEHYIVIPPSLDNWIKENL